MFTDQTMERLNAMLSRHGEVSRLTVLPKDNGNSCTILATMKSTKDAYSVMAHHDFPLFGFDTLIIDGDWVRRHLENP